jgi:tetrahydromethanopterin S-methyltransferase subunit G
MTKKPSKKSGDSFLENPLNKMGVLLERLEYKIDVIAEGVLSLGQRTDRIETRLDSIEETVGYLKNASVHQNEFQPLAKRVTKIEKAVFK